MKKFNEFINEGELQRSLIQQAENLNQVDRMELIRDLMVQALAEYDRLSKEADKHGMAPDKRFFWNCHSELKSILDQKFSARGYGAQKGDPEWVRNWWDFKGRVISYEKRKRERGTRLGGELNIA